MGDNTIFYGDYSEATSRTELQTVRFMALALNSDQLWENGSLSAFYISQFWETYFHSHINTNKDDIRDSVRYIAAELIGNAVKYSSTPDILVNITLNPQDPEFRISVVNKVDYTNAETYKKFIEHLLASDPEKLYIEQLERNATDENWRSCIGFLTIMLDFGGHLAWKFNMDDKTNTLTATTMVRLPVTR
jgi:hypothetical protein